MWTVLASPVITVPLWGFFHGWTLKDLGLTFVVTLFLVAVLWGLTFLVEFIRSPGLIHNEQQSAAQGYAEAARQKEIAMATVRERAAKIERLSNEVRALKEQLEVPKLALKISECKFPDAPPGGLSTLAALVDAPTRDFGSTRIILYVEVINEHRIPTTAGYSATVTDASGSVHLRSMK
jgi:hypothetical protein